MATKKVREVRRDGEVVDGGGSAVFGRPHSLCA